MDSSQLLMWWQGLHPCNVVLDWVAFFIGVSFLALLYSRLKAGFLIVWLVANGVSLIPVILNATYPQTPDRPIPIGTLIEVLWVIHHIIGITGTFMFFMWFWKTRSPNKASESAFSPVREK